MRSRIFDVTEGGNPKRDRQTASARKKVTAGYIERAALHYLGRFNSSEKNLRVVLSRKVRRRNIDNASPSTEQLSWIDDVVRKCVRYGYINDLQYAQQRAALLLRRGKPVHAISQDLRHKGIANDEIQKVLEQLSSESGENANQLAAASYVKRRRFGSFRRPLNDPDEQCAKREKELASMARAGFGYELSSQVLDMTQEEVIDLLA